MLFFVALRHHHVVRRVVREQAVRRRPLILSLTRPLRRRPRPRQVASLAERLKAGSGAIDIVINNAGYFYGPAETVVGGLWHTCAVFLHARPVREWRRVMWCPWAGETRSASQ